MKLNDLIKQLNAIKKVHGGELSCDLMNCVTSNFSSIQSLRLIYPRGAGADRRPDHTKAPCGIWIADFKE